MKWFFLALLACAAFVAVSVAVLWLRWITAGHPLHAARARLGWGALLGYGGGIGALAKRIDYEPSELRRFEPRYRRVAIPKRRAGHRILHVPDDRTKALQRAILRRVLGGLRAHPAATGFERGLSIVDNARPHVGRAVVIHMDVVDFFPTTDAARIDAYMRRVGWNAAAAALITRLVTHEGGLPQGAPTSPRLSNLVNFGLDARLARFAARRNAVYTRYADDITISHRRDSSRRVRGTIDIVRQTLRVHGYTAHGRAKTSVRRRHQRQVVTGLVVNDGVRLPREVRRRLRAIRHHLATGRPATMSPAQMHGWNAYESMIERASGAPPRSRE